MEDDTSEMEIPSKTSPYRLARGFTTSFGLGGRGGRRPSEWVSGRPSCHLDGTPHKVRYLSTRVASAGVATRWVAAQRHTVLHWPRKCQERQRTPVPLSTRGCG